MEKLNCLHMELYMKAFKIKTLLEEVFLLSEQNLKSKLKIKDTGSAGRPRLEETQPLLLSEIVRIARHGSAAHEKRQDEIYRSILTLDDLTEQLNKDGFHVKRSSLYL